ncbi:discoidin domain-containing protein [Actinoplanes sp. NPDC026623]|uniref:discoidin domain-containing protein n=1 Tax=Actinoplanes sp. NPDC026623 TaxID=3155610 RepID=UPI0034101A7B
MFLSRLRFAGPLALAIIALTALGPAPASAADTPTIPATVNHLIIDDKDGSPTTATILQLDYFSVQVNEPALDKLPSGTRVKIAVPGASTPAKAAEILQDDPTAITAVEVVAKPGPSAGTQGAVVHNLTVVPFTWAGASPFHRTMDSLKAMATKSLQEWANFGRGQIIPGTVTILDPVVTAKPDPCSFGSYANEAKKVLGHGPSGPTDHWMYVPSEYLGCGWYGMAYVPGNELALADDLPWGEAPDFGGGWKVAAHELGHNFGLGHANEEWCSTATTCTVAGYGNDHQIMGGNNTEPLNAAHSAILGAFTDADTPLITSPGTYQLTSINEKSGIRGLKFHPTTGNDIYVEYRPTAPNGFSRQGWIGGLEANRKDGSTSVLLDMTPGPAKNDDATQPDLMTDNTWQVPNTGLSVRLTSAEATTATVVVTDTATDTQAPAQPTRVEMETLTNAWLSSTTFPVSWTPAATEQADGVVGYRVTARDFDGAQWVAGAPAGQTSVSMSLPANSYFQQGPMTVSVQALDAAGNASPEELIDMDFDNTPPGKVTIQQPPADSDVGAADFQLTWSTPTDDRSGLDHYDVLVNNEVVQTVDADVNQTTVRNPATPAITVGVRAVDMAGNASSATASQITLTAASADVNRALGKTVTVSSTEAAGLPGSNAVDGNASTRWASNYVDPSWIQIDLGTTVSIGQVILRWENAYGRSYRIQTSDDGTTWTDIYTTTTGNGGVDNLTGLTGSGRYLRLYGTARATGYGYSLYEVGVYS